MALCLILFLGKFIKNATNKTISKIGNIMFYKLKLVKWSHLHDFAMTVAMIITFGFFSQTIDYNTNSVLQIIGISFSYICVSVLLAYYIFMSHKLHSIVRLSLHDPRKFCHKNYLFR